MSRKSTDEESQAKTKSHLHYIEVLKEVRAILVERKEQDAHTSSQTPNLGCRKRKEFSPTRQSTDSNKAVKTETAAPNPTHKQTDGAWRQLIASGCEKPSTGKKSLAIKPASYAAAVLVAPVS